MLETTNHLKKTKKNEESKGAFPFGLEPLRDARNKTKSRVNVKHTIHINKSSTLALPF